MPFPGLTTLSMTVLFVFRIFSMKNSMGARSFPEQYFWGWLLLVQMHLYTWQKYLYADLMLHE
jgi:hypothetical protein